jgi:hypothetical protein
MSVMIYLMILKFRAQDIREQGLWSLFTFKQHFTWQLGQAQIERSVAPCLRMGRQQRRAA